MPYNAPLMTSRTRLVLLLLVAATAFLAGLTGIREFDAFHHLAMGRHVAQNGLSGTEPFLFPFEGAKTLPAPYWLGALAFYVAERIAGLQGIVLLVGLAAAVTFVMAADDALLAGLGPTVAPGPSAASITMRAAAALLPIVLAIGVWRIRAVSRPEVFGLATLAWLLHALRHGGKRSLLAIPVVAFLWANVHPSVAIGLGALGLYMAGAWLDVVMAPRGEHRDALQSRALLLLGVTVASVILATIAPGSALRPALSFAGTFVPGGAVGRGMEIARSRIIELQRPSIEILLGPPGALLLLLPLGWLAARRRPTVAEGLLLLALIAVAVRSVRFVPWATTVAAPLIGRDLVSGVLRLEDRLRLATATVVPRVRRGLAAALPLAVLAAGTWCWVWLPLPVSLAPLHEILPIRVGEILIGELPAVRSARIWNSITTGGYLEWTLPGAKIFQDGRLMWRDGDAEGAVDGPAKRASFAPLEERWRFDALVMDYPSVPNVPGVLFMNEDPAADRKRYALVGFDDGAMLYVRRDGALAHLAQREFKVAVPSAPVNASLLLDPARRTALAADYRRAMMEAPSCKICRAGLWLVYAAEGNARAANTAWPGGKLPVSLHPLGHPGHDMIRSTAKDLYRIRFREGQALVDRKDLARALVAFQSAALLDDCAESRTFLGLTLYDLGDAEGALRELDAAIAHDPSLGVPHYGRGMALEEAGRTREAAEEFRTYLRLEPSGSHAAEAAENVARLELAPGERPSR